MSKTDRLIEKINKYNKYLENKDNKDKYQDKLNKYINKYKVLMGGKLSEEDIENYVKPVTSEVDQLLKIHQKAFDEKINKFLEQLITQVQEYNNIARKVDNEPSEENKVELEKELAVRDAAINELEKKLKEKSNNDEKIIQVIAKIRSSIINRQKKIEQEFKLSDEVKENLRKLLTLTTPQRKKED